MVISKKTKLPVEKASAQFGQFGCATNKGGKFSLIITSAIPANATITISCVGFRNKTFLVSGITNPFIVEMEDTAKVLQEVIVSAQAKTIIEKAIARIGINYPDKPSVVSGILRLHFGQSNGYNYNNDAFIDMYTPPYKQGNTADVRLVNNKLNIQNGKGFDSLNVIRWIGAYSSASSSDFVSRRPAFMQIKSMKYFAYELTGKTLIDDHTVYVVDVLSRDNLRGVDYKRMNGTLYIDTINYAFVRGDFYYYDIKHLFFIPITDFFVTTLYEQNGNKWNLKKVQTKAEGNSGNIVLANTSTNFVTTSIDTVNVHKFSYDETIQHGDVTQKVNRIADSTQWIKYDSVFVKAEKQNEINEVVIANRDTLNIQITGHGSSFKRKVQGLAQYIHDRYSMGIGFTRLPINIMANQQNISGISMFSFDIIGKLQLSKTLLFQVNSCLDAGIGGVENKQTGYYLSNAFTIKQYSRNIFLSIFAGYNKIAFSSDKKSIKNTFHNWAIGLNSVFEINHKLSMFVSGSYNHTFSNKIQGDIIIEPARFSYSLGIMYKL